MHGSQRVVHHERTQTCCESPAVISKACIHGQQSMHNEGQQCHRCQNPFQAVLASGMRHAISCSCSCVFLCVYVQVEWGWMEHAHILSWHTQWNTHQTAAGKSSEKLSSSCDTLRNIFHTAESNFHRSLGCIYTVERFVCIMRRWHVSSERVYILSLSFSVSQPLLFECALFSLGSRDTKGVTTRPVSFSFYRDVDFPFSSPTYFLLNTS